MLPSVVIAQAAIESAVGTSELAQNANALFGIKLNGWTGRSYVKDATEQLPDGRTLRYGPVIGCGEYVLTCRYLQKCGYATSQSYAETLINYIKKHNLRRYDEITEKA